MAHEKLVEDLWVTTRCVHVQPLDEKKRPIVKDGGYVNGSGFFINGAWDNTSGQYPPQTGKIHLYTCWHVVTGHDPREAKTPNNWIQPRYLKVTGVLATGKHSIDGSDSIIVNLYDELGAPAWEQESDHTPHRDFNKIGIYLPKYLDAIRMEVELSSNQIARWTIDPMHLHDQFFELGEDVFVCGFPYGFSAMGETPIPVFLKRALAAISTENYKVSLLDGSCSPVMSGGPIFKRIDTKWLLVGMYFGSILPKGRPDRSDLGTALGITFIRQGFGTVNRMP